MTWEEYEEMIEKQSALEARSQPKLQGLRTLYESECVAAQGDGRLHTVPFSGSFVETPKFFALLIYFLPDVSYINH